MPNTRCLSSAFICSSAITSVGRTTTSVVAAAIGSTLVKSKRSKRRHPPQTLNILDKKKPIRKHHHTIPESAHMQHATAKICRFTPADLLALN
jgi:hypothetical protein